MEAIYLVGVDCSECSERAIQYATERAEASGGQVLIAHVIEWSPYSFNTPQENEERHKRREEELQVAHAQIVDPIVSRMQEKGLSAKGLVRHGHVAETLDQLAREQEATSIIVGRHGSSKLHAQIFGSVPGKLVQIADRPVTVVP